MTRKDKIIAKLYELVELYETHTPPHKKLREELAALESEPEGESEDMSCDVEGCDNERASGGVYWSDTGYWILCSTHCSDARNGKPQPQMKQSAIDRENSRDKVTGFLPPKEPSSPRHQENDKAEERKTAEEREKIFAKMQQDFQPTLETPFKQGMYSGYAFGLQDGYKFASQSLPEISDEEINTASIYHGTSRESGVGVISQVYWRSGAKWYKSEIRKRI